MAYINRCDNPFSRNSDNTYPPEPQEHLIDRYLQAGQSFFEQGQLAQAAECFAQLTVLAPSNASNWLTHGFILFRQKRPDKAIASLRKAVELDPNSPESLMYLAESLRQVGRFEESLPFYRAMLPFGDRFPQAVYGYSLSLLATGRLADGWDAFEFRKVCTLGTWERHLLPDWQGPLPDLTIPTSDTRSNTRSNTLPKEPLAFLQSSAVLSASSPSPFSPQETVVVFAEGSIAEQVMYSTVFSDIIPQVGTCVLECETSLHSLFLRSFPEVCVVPLPEKEVTEGTLFVGNRPAGGTVSNTGNTGNFSKTGSVDSPTMFSAKLDSQVAMGSLPRFFRRSVFDFPKKQAVLVPDENLVTKWENRLQPHRDKLKIGFLWHGNWSDEPESQRSIPLETMRNLLCPTPSPYRTMSPSLHDTEQLQPFDLMELRRRQTHWFCLQNGSPQKQFSHIQTSWNVSNVSIFSEIFRPNLDEMAAFLVSMDLVITPPGYVAQLAGGLGVPTWVLLPNLHDWRWRMGGIQSDWHASVRLLKQGDSESWDGFMNKVEAALEFYLAKYFAMPVAEETLAVIPHDWELELEELLLEFAA